MEWNWLILLIQLVVTVLAGVFFSLQIKQARRNPPASKHESSRELEKMARLRGIHLTRPLSETVRPTSLEEIIGQEEGIRSLKAILCCKNPQHVLIYGPPGIGKTCAARLVLEEAKRMNGTPFKRDAPFVEVDATCIRFDERAIADPLIGSVHDPIYQGAGPLGIQGVPQPKPGAVTRAHGGVLFLDEIGELHPVQMNKLLKVLEDRKVMLDSAYYSPDDPVVPAYIHDIFHNGLPADFRLIGATTRSPQDIPAALRSRCMEIFFRPLEERELVQIAKNAAEKAGYALSIPLAETISHYAACGRDAVNMVQMCAGMAQLDRREAITLADAEWVIHCGHYARRPGGQADTDSRCGLVHGLAVLGESQGAVMDVEASMCPGSGQMVVTGIVDQEELGHEGHRLSRRSTVSCSAENVKTLLLSMKIWREDCDVHINFPGGMPVDGPSAGVAMAVAAVSALTGRSVRGDMAVTGEVSVLGAAKPVGGVPAKVEAARRAGIRQVLIPAENNMEYFCKESKLLVTPVHTVSEALRLMLSAAPAVQAPAEAVCVHPSALPAAQRENESNSCQIGNLSV